MFAIATPVIYVICEMRNWPLFTYHPGTDRFDLFYAAARRDEGPAMHWYGWTANTLHRRRPFWASSPRCCRKVSIRKIPLSLVWIMPLAAVPILIYALRFFWRW